MHISRRTRVRVAAAAAMAALVAAPAAVVATEHEEPPSEAIGAAEARILDAKIIAADRGWSFDATMKHLDEQDEFGDVTRRLRERYPDRFAGAEFADAPGGTSFVRFAGQVPSAAQAMAAEVPVDIQLTGGRKHSERDLRQRSVDVLRFYQSRGIDEGGSAVQPNGRIAVTLRAELAGEVPELPPTLRLGVDLELIEEPVHSDFHTYGGQWIWDSTGGSCTTGFSVDDLSSTSTGVSTAAHCSGMDSMVHDHAPSPSPAPFQAQHLGLFGDFEWHTALNHGEFANYYAGPGSGPNNRELREVNSVESWGSINVNNTYCVYSRVNALRTCDQVYSNFVNSFTGLTFVSSLVATDDLHATNGDSGGPWSLSTEAAGLVRGAQWIWFSTRATWSVADLMPVGIGVAVMTQ